MLLSKPQKRLLEVLKQFGVLRGSQLQRLLAAEYPSLPWDALLHQLECGGLVQRQDNCVGLPGRAAERGLLDAVDVMLLLGPEVPEAYQPGTPPFTLTFFRQRQEKLWRYDICTVSSGREPIVCAALENINPKYRLVVFLLEQAQQKDILRIPCEHCFAWKENGVFRFYKYT